MSQRFATGRYVVRARRLADLSQRELADTLGVSPSTVARMESGAHRVTVDVFARVIGVAGLSLAVLDATGQPVAPVPQDVLRDNAQRRFPGHLDVDPPEQVPFLRVLMPRYDRPAAQGWYRLRPARDRQRARDGVPVDHPTAADLRDHAVSAATHRAGRARGGFMDTAGYGECTCETACWLGTTCERDCSCQCEPAAWEPTA